MSLICIGCPEREVFSISPVGAVWIYFRTTQMTNCIIHKIFKNIEIVKFNTITLKSILKSVKLPRLVAKCCKMQKIWGCKICKFCIILYHARNVDNNGVIQKYTKFSNFTGLYFSHFKTLQNKLCGFHFFF